MHVPYNASAADLEFTRLFIYFGTTNQLLDYRSCMVHIAPPRIEGSTSSDPSLSNLKCYSFVMLMCRPLSVECAIKVTPTNASYHDDSEMVNPAKSPICDTN